MKPVLHPEADVLERFMLGLLPPAERREIARHLLSGCPECKEVTSGLWEPADALVERLSHRFPEPMADEADYDDVLDRVFHRVAATESWLARQRSDAGRLQDELLRCPAERRHLLLANCRRFQDRSLCERLLETSASECFKNPRRAVEVAELALRVVDLLAAGDEGEGDGFAGLRVRTWAHLGNAYRVSLDTEGAVVAFERTEELLGEGRVLPSEKARVLSFLASWRKSQERFGEASQILDRVAAIYRQLGQWSPLGRTLLEKSTVCGETGDGEGEMRLLRRALALIDPQEDPRVFLAARHNLIHALYESGRAREAFALLYHTRPLYLQAGDRMNLLRLRWLEGLIAFGMHRFDQSEAALREVREAFFDLEMGIDAALASLDLASLYIAQGRTADLSRVADEALGVLQVHGSHREAAAALLVFCNSARLNQAGGELVREVSTFLKRSRNRPDLRFAHPSRPL